MITGTLTLCCLSAVHTPSPSAAAQPCFPAPSEANFHRSESGSPSPIGERAASSAPGSPRIAQQDDIRIVHHPNSNIPERLYRFEEYTESVEAFHNSIDTSEPVTTTPWRPFRTRLDFEIAELVQDTNMSRRQRDSLIRLIKRCIAEPEQFTLINEDDLQRTWDAAQKAHMSGAILKFKNPGTGEDSIEYPMYARPIIDWMFDILDDKKLQEACQFDAIEISKYNGTEFDRHYNEPWTGKFWWETQVRNSKLPDNAGIFCIILHADKTRLSLFGKAKGYPIYARCGNLPLHIRNGNCNGCERLVGYLPIVGDEHSEDFTNKGYVNFKRIVWTDGFREVLKSVDVLSETGIRYVFYNGTSRWLYPIVLILSADYEEQSIMAMIRGVGSKYPCPVCLVPDNAISDLGRTHPLRTTADMSAVLESTTTMNATDKEQTLMNVGLRDIKNLFWEHRFWEVYKALTWDRLHAFHLGLFRDHLLKEFVRLLKTFSSELVDRINKQLIASPRWSGLKTFSTLHALGEFSDARTFEDLSKVCLIHSRRKWQVLLFASHDVFAPPRNDHRKSEPYILLRLIRAYLELDMFASLRNPSESLTQKHEKAILKFGEILEEFKGVTTNSDKSWDAAPKVHTHCHVPEDVRNKGATVNGNAKTFERAHGPLHDNYMKTNFKNVGEQLTRMSDEHVAGTVIRDRINLLEASTSTEEAEEEKRVVPVIGFEHVSLGSKQRAKSIQAVVDSAPAEFKGAFLGLHSKIATRLNIMKFDKSNRLIKLKPINEVTEYRLIRAHFSSHDDWTANRDLIRASPSFWDQLRYDHLAWQTTNTTIAFGRLLSAFTIEYGGETAYLALVLPYDYRPLRTTRTKDEDFDFLRVRRRLLKESMVISIESIIRGACLPEAWDCEYGDEYILNDCIDTDWWLRSKALKGRGGGMAWAS
ncbi:hypothetical protein BKA70DRAFT_1111973 [Coprinopsis sp. MPI-PUGE-AT-0042]|nr:hypothetical protein BKA70DRAFT_1111973 [Coprinopsis sp. MPI-PUGE-AT-0042]